MAQPRSLFLMEIPVSLDPAAISLSLQLPLLLTLGADPITKNKGFISAFYIAYCCRERIENFTF